MTDAVGGISAPRLALLAARQLLYPRRCPFCNKVLGSVPLCESCEGALEELRHRPTMRLDPESHYLGRLSGAAAPFEYRGRVRRSVLHAKYEGAPWAASELGVYMARLLFASDVKLVLGVPLVQPAPGFGMGYDCIVPVPPTSRSRGYNVPELMARPIAQALGLPLEAHAMVRHRADRHQAGLPFEQRLENAAGAFAVKDAEAVDGRRVLLVDDVITTGATASACAQALLDAGAQTVFAVALAAAEKDGKEGKEQI